MRKFLVLCLALLLPLAACGDDDGTGPSTNIVGTFNLQTVNGAPLPVTLSQAGTDRLDLTAGQITFREDRTFTAEITFREISGGLTTNETDGQIGTYTVSGNTVQLTSTLDGTVATATISGNTLTSNQQGFTLVYRK